MNFLAHFHLAHPTDASRVGALLGDFVRGTPESLLSRYPEDLVRGIMLHRQIDRFTDSHPSFIQARRHLSAPRRRFAGIVIDLFFDHFLTLHWEQFSPVPLPTFIEETYTILQRHPAWMTPELLDLLPKMRKENWLQNYHSIGGLKLTFVRISKRRPFLSPIAGAEEELQAHYSQLEDAFHTFYPDLQNFAKNTFHWSHSSS